MPAFLGLVRLAGGRVDDTLDALRASHAEGWSWCDSTDRSAALGHTTGDPRATLARAGDWMAVGMARLDNRDEIRAWSGAPADISDLQVILAGIAARGVPGIRSILGDFAIVACHARSRDTIVARDAFGVKPLFYRALPEGLALSSHAAPLAGDADYDADYVAEFILSGFDRDHRTPWRGVRAVPPGHCMVVRDGVTTLTRYWSASQFPPRELAPRNGAGEGSRAAFRALLETAIASNVSGADDTWSQLSGGLDSSTLVSVAETMRTEGSVRGGVAGVITMVDSLDDEWPYAHAVAERYGLRHEVVKDYWLWQDDGTAPPRNDVPDSLYPFYARNRRLCEIVKSAGGRVLLSGVGPDHYLAGNRYFFADWLAQGRVLTAAREMWRWSNLAKTGFLRFALDNAIMPLAPASLRRLGAPRWAQVYDWIAPDFARRLGLNERTTWGRALDAPAGRKYAGQVEVDMTHLPVCIDRGAFEDGIEMRYPYLYRPLVEYCLQLPRELRTQPFARKWVMREAAKGIVPEIVRVRRTKGAISGRTRWSLRRESAVVDSLLCDSILAELGCIDPVKLRRALDQAIEGDDKVLFAAVRTLALETWLRVTNDRWADCGAPTESQDLALAPAG